MARKSSPKSKSRSVTSTGNKGVKKPKKLKKGLFLTIVGDVQFFLLEVKKSGKIVKYEVSPAMVVDCVLYCLEQGIHGKGKDVTDQPNSGTNVESESKPQK